MAEIVNKRGSSKQLSAKRADLRSETLVMEKPESAKASVRWPAEGPHARRDLINEDATPGTGLFSNQSDDGTDVDPGAG